MKNIHTPPYFSLTLLTLALVTSWCQTLVLAAEKPNVVFIISDDQHWDDYGFLGHKHLQTPNLDQLAAQSLVFTRGHVPSSLCRPSLATMLTGLYPHQHRITSNDPPFANTLPGTKAQKQAEFLRQREETIKYMDQAVTLPRLLAQQGYVSFQTGKWWEGHYVRGGFTAGMSEGGRHGDKGLEIGRKTMDPMFDFMKQAQEKNQPFFIWYAPFLPHSPHNAEERLVSKYKDVAPNLETAKYWANITWLDETCGSLFSFLEDRKLAENTLIVYVCDNGWLQDPNKDHYAPRSKQSQYEGGLRTPIMFKLPGKVAPAQSDALAISIDIAPTILSIVGSAPTEQMPGINLLNEHSRDARKTICGEVFEHNAVDIHNPASSLKWRWCIAGDLKLIVPNPSRLPDAVVELYDLSTDPGEAKNLADSRPEDVQRLMKEMDVWWNPEKE